MTRTSTARRRMKMRAMRALQLKRLRAATMEKMTTTNPK